MFVNHSVINSTLHVNIKQVCYGQYLKHSRSPCDRVHVSHFAPAVSWFRKQLGFVSWLLYHRDWCLQPTNHSVCPISHDGWSVHNHQMSSSSTAVLVVPPWQQPQPRLTDGPLKRQCTWSGFCFQSVGFLFGVTVPLQISWTPALKPGHTSILLNRYGGLVDFPDHVFTFYEKHLGGCPVDVHVCESQSIGLQSECTVALSSPRCPRPAAP